MKRYLAALWLLLLALGVSASPTSAQMYRWTNERGEVHFSEGLESVPERFRAGAILVGDPRASGPSRPPAAAPPAGSEPGVLARVPYVPGSPIIVSVRVNGGRSVQLLLDTGADRTMISPRALSAVGVDMRPVGRGIAQGVAGSAEVDYVRVERLEVGGARVGPMAVAAHDARMARGEGLLGRDFLDRFVVNIDSSARVVVLGRR